MNEEPLPPEAPRPLEPVPPRAGAGPAVILVAVIVSAVTGALAGGVVANRLATPEPAESTFSLPTAPPASGASSTEAVVQTVRDVLPAVVTIVNKLPGGRPQSSGSGSVIDGGRGYVLTNNHVVANVRGDGAGDSFDVIFSDGRTVAGKLLGRDPETDIAVLQIPAAGLRAVALGNSDDVPVGAQVVAIGSALGEFRNTVTVGVVSAKGRRAPAQVRPDVLLEDLVQTDAAISPGNSGGPLVWVATRQVIGMNTLVVREAGAEGLGFAISSNTVRQITEEIIKNGGRVERGFIGIRYAELTAQIAQALGLPQQTHGVVVSQVLPGSPGAQAGLQRDDVLTAVTDQQIDAEHPLATIMLRFRAGDRVRLAIVRDGKPRTVELTLGRQ